MARSRPGCSVSSAPAGLRTCNAPPRSEPAASGRDPPPRVAFNIGEAAAMLGKGAAARRRECERKARREGDHLVADLALGIRAHKHGGRWFVTVPRTLLA